jgi:ABC-type transport system involved in multi-copper enzyme maturation permease subunit
MKKRRLQFGLPLLSRELADQAAHIRHYVLRCLCAIAMFGTCYITFGQLLVQDQFSGVAWLGQGFVLVEYVTRVQAIIILLFLPAITCGAISGEKERNTLAVLLTTRLGPRTIVLEKLASRLVVVFMLLMLSLPLLAVAYSMGGVSLPDLLTRVRDLAELSFFVASLSLMCSAWCGSTVSAFFMSYFLAGALMLGTAGLLGYSLIYHIGRPGPVIEQALILIAPTVFLMVAVRCLIRRAFVTPRNFVLAFFRGLDNLYTRMNVIVGNVVLVREKALLPADKPIAWRETAKKSLGTVRYLVRILVAIELPTVALLMSAGSSGVNLAQGVAVASGLWFTVWSIGAALVAVSCANIVSGERTRQTLPILLASPIPGAEIVRQLFAGPRRLIFVLWIPFATIAVFEFWFHQGASRFGDATLIERLVCSLLQVAIYPFLIGWTTFYLGTRVRSALWAVLASLLGLLIVILAPYLVGLLAQFGLGRDAAIALFYSSPATIVVLNETQGATLRYTFANFAIFGGLALLARNYCLRHADRLLGRSIAPADTRSQTAPNTRAFSLPQAPQRRPNQGTLVSEPAH